MPVGTLVFPDVLASSSSGCVRARLLGWRLTGKGARRGVLPCVHRISRGRPADGQVPDRLIGAARWQMDLDLGFHLDDAGGGLDQPEPQRVELGDAPG